MARPFVDFIAFIHEQFRPRLVKLPIMSDAALQRLSMPVLAILGGKDALLDSAESRFRLELTVPHAKILYYPESGHLLPTQTSEISDFLRAAVRQPSR
jgi:pimeloyl-ACP methyl ester carboxylesterase